MKKALVTLLSGVPTGVVTGDDLETLWRLGEEFVGEQGCNGDYTVCDVEDLGVRRGDELARRAWVEDRLGGGGIVNVQRLLTAMRGNHVTLQEAADRLELSLRLPPSAAAIRTLAKEAVDGMGDIFYDADQYSDELLPCPECGAMIPVLCWACADCGATFDEPQSKNDAQYDEAVNCVEQAIRKALALAVGV